MQPTALSSSEAPQTLGASAVDVDPAADIGQQSQRAASSTEAASASAAAVTVSSDASSLDLPGALQGAPSSYQVGMPDAPLPPVRGITASIVRRAEMSTWRWPSVPGELPTYVQRNFRVKTFGLIGFQLLLVFGLMVVVDVSLTRHHGFKSQSQFIFYALGFLALCSILLLHSVREKYPVNYLVLAVVTLVVGVFWGTTRLAFNTWLHFQVIGVLCITMFVAAAMSVVWSTQKMEPWSLLFASLMPGWVVATILDFLIVAMTPAELDIQTSSALVSVCLAFLLMLAVLVLDVGVMLVKCNPDDFMRVIISMDSALLVVVSMPIFMLSCCILHTIDLHDQVAMEEAGQGAPNMVPPMGP
mmetsp:Transcript_46034/g.121616  ORF Transcript_46034/g.121616 Transcript_46034/m.121616 type:complete len:358 (+) Transcript_46034:77-1150(+)